jgi:hypothetical protein
MKEGRRTDLRGNRNRRLTETGFSTAVGIGRCGSSVRSHRGGGDQSQSGRRGSPGRYGARGRVGGAVSWPEVPVRVEALLGGNDGAWIFEDAPRCGARA